MSRHNHQCSVEEGRSLLGGTHAMISRAGRSPFFLMRTERRNRTGPVE
jgi:hypothetical protein